MRFPFLVLSSLAAALAIPVALSACGDSGGGAEGPSSPPSSSVPPGDAGPYQPLGMNDVTVLVPLPAAIASPVLLRGADVADDGAPLVSRALFDRLDKADASGPPGPLTFGEAYENLHVTAVRFDLCDRNLPGECAPSADGRLRIVLQPLSDQGGAEDVGFHAFYAIPAAENAAAVAALRDLARVHAEPASAPLRTSPGLTGPASEAYAAKLRAFVRRFGGETKLVRLTVNAQPALSSAVQWIFRGVEKRGGALEDIAIPGTGGAIEQSVRLSGPAGDVTYEVTPASDTPAGVSGALSASAFAAADDAQRRAMLGALAVAEDPMRSAPDNVSCVACHASTVVTSVRAKTLGIEPSAIAGRYVSPYDLSVAGGKSRETTRTLRALGWLHDIPMISQRVANDTAQVLAEIERRYPK